ncbi:MAG TPA: hypothetical protein VMT61_17045 [Candidatus Binataceae bacterium]|nr:hypothetical protein [Candidatus Binataceae bacterium]
MNQVATTGSMLATKVGLMFAPQAGIETDKGAATAISLGSNSCKSLSSCKSVNSCKSHSSCKSASSCKSHSSCKSISSCKNLSSCKSKGWVLAA